MTRIAQGFAESAMRDDGHVYMSVVPYSQNVNVYDAKRPNRPRNWARADALKPEELEDWNFFDETGIKDLASPDTPDALGKRFCPLRGLNLGENYFWDHAPAGHFYISYWVWEKSAVPPGYDFPWKDWFSKPRPTNDDFGCDEKTRQEAINLGQEDCKRSDEELDFFREIKTMIANKGCPATPVLPLQNRLEDITSELILLKKQHIFYKGLTAGNLNFGFALGWGAMTLAPAFRGSDGWGGDPQVPRDFDSGNGEHQKAIVMLMKTEMDSFFSDSDASTAVPGNISATTDHTPNDMPKRYKALCDSLRASGHRIRVFLLVAGGQSENLGLSNTKSFDEGGRKGFQFCAEKPSDISSYNSDAFNDVEGAMTSRLGEIAGELKQRGSFVRLMQ
ncbi:hypothetical protein MKL09_16695 [Methylobacterium sp. J-048]|uniref:hypothetical protein n=1 Tax=Methylobacterium sp. J-048 TaxID=2836635 RepID=UPI001FBAFE0B|nr:hypothetical protein [Methylobacterium sp. J-048]MCJ2058188.1 hypothetical protein [Methylobacterium sp. J-048]